MGPRTSGFGCLWKDSSLLHGRVQAVAPAHLLEDRSGQSSLHQLPLRLGDHTPHRVQHLGALLELSADELVPESESGLLDLVVVAGFAAGFGSLALGILAVGGGAGHTTPVATGSGGRRIGSGLRRWRRGSSSLHNDGILENHLVHVALLLVGVVHLQVVQLLGHHLLDLFRLGVSCRRMLRIGGSVYVSHRGVAQFRQIQVMASFHICSSWSIS